MKKMFKVLAMICFCLIVSVSSASALIFISNGSIQDLQVYSIDAAMTGIEYNRVSGYTSTPMFNPAPDTGYFWLFTNSTNNTLSLGIQLDAVNSGTWGSAVISFTGAPNTAFVEFSDDPGELRQNGPGSFRGDWVWSSVFNDGGYIGGLAVPPADDWTITASLLSSTGINAWYFLSGSGDAANPTMIALNMTTDLIIRDPQASVPEPSTLLLLGAGLFGFGIFSRKRRK